MRTLVTIGARWLLLFLTIGFKIWHITISTWRLIENPKMWNISQTTYRRAKRIGIWDPSCYEVYMWAVFQVKLVEISLGSFSAILRKSTRNADTLGHKPISIKWGSMAFFYCSKWSSTCKRSLDLSLPFVTQNNKIIIHHDYRYGRFQRGRVNTVEPAGKRSYCWTWRLWSRVRSSWEVAAASRRLIFRGGRSTLACVHFHGIPGTWVPFCLHWKTGV